MNVLGLVLLLASRVLFSFTDPEITESSGLVDLGALMVTTNDSGDDAVLYVVDPRTGATVGRTHYAPEVTDVEALAPAGADAVWAADIGDNTETRRVVEVYRVPVGRGERRVQAPSYRLLYPDGPHDAESLISPGGRLYVITKSLSGGTVYAAPKLLDPDKANRLTAIGTVDEWATDAAMLGSKHLLVRGYGVAKVLTFPGLQEVGSFVLPAQEQGEGVSVGPDGRIRLSSEGVRSPVLQIALPDDVRTALHPTPTPAPSPEPSPQPAASESKSSGTSVGVLALAGGCAVGLAVAVLWSRRRR